MTRKLLPQPSRSLLATLLLVALARTAFAAVVVTLASHSDAGQTGATCLWKHWVSAQCPQPEQVENLARYDALVIEPWCWYQADSAAAIEAIYQRNPDIQIFMYLNSVAVRTNTAPLRTWAEAHPDEWMCTEPAPAASALWLPMSPSSEAWHNAIADYVAAARQRFPNLHLYLDWMVGWGAAHDMYWHRLVDYDCDGAWDNDSDGDGQRDNTSQSWQTARTAYIRGQRHLIETLRARFPDLLIVGNAITYWPLGNWPDDQDYFDVGISGYVVELFGHHFTTRVAELRGESNTWQNNVYQPIRTTLGWLERHSDALIVLDLSVETKHWLYHKQGGQLCPQLAKLAQLVVQGQGDTPRADELRDEIRAHWGELHFQLYNPQTRLLDDFRGLGEWGWAVATILGGYHEFDQSGTLLGRDLAELGLGDLLAPDQHLVHHQPTWLPQYDWDLGAPTGPVEMDEATFTIARSFGDVRLWARADEDEVSWGLENLSPTLTPPASQCVRDGNGNGRGEVVDIMTTAAKPGCQSCLPMVAANWHRPWPTSTPPPTSLPYEDSPFGFHPASVYKPGYPDKGFVDAQNIGVRWHRPPVYAYWFLVQPDLDRQVYDFSRYDQEYGSVPPGIHILANIAPQGPIDEGRCLPGSWLPVDEAKYVAFVKATVERYDGDGVDDMPGVANPIKYWQVGNEPNNQQRSGFAQLQRITYQAIKEVCPDCTVLIGGVAGFPDDYIRHFDAVYSPILAELGGQYVDVFDFHWYGTATGDYRLRDTATGEDVYAHIRATLTANGFPPDLPIWITEMGSYSGDPSDFQFPLFLEFPPQSERQQAADYFKRFVYALSRGVQKVFPAFGLMEGFKHDDGYFDHTGLIYDGEDFGHGTDPSTGGDPGLGVKKLGYYTYKKMTEKLEGADWSTLKALHDGTDSDHLYLFRVLKEGRPLYIAWWDYFDEPDYTPGDTKPITLTGLSGTTVTVTTVVPSADTGREVTDYATAFEVSTYPVVDGAVTIPLGEDPVVIEERSVIGTRSDPDWGFIKPETFQRDT